MKKAYLVTVQNKQYCGVDAGGVQFANGKAMVPEGRILDWFRDTEGYEVEELKDEDEDSKKEDGEDNANDSRTPKKPATGKK